MTYIVECTDSAHAGSVPKDAWHIVSRPRTVTGLRRVLKPLVAQQRAGGRSTWAFNIRVTDGNGDYIPVHQILGV